MIPHEKPAAERSLRALVVDDQESVRSVLRRFISRLGWEVATAENGFQAVESAKKKRFDLYVLDVRMPGMNGLETLREIRRIDPSAQVVMMTGCADMNILPAIRAEGVIDILAKPFDLGRLREILEEVLRA